MGFDGDKGPRSGYAAPREVGSFGRDTMRLVFVGLSVGLVVLGQEIRQRFRIAVRRVAGGFSF